MIRDGHTKNVDYKHVNGLQVRRDAYRQRYLEIPLVTTRDEFFFLQITDDMVLMLAKFMDTLTVELGYPCSHRRMKKYITDDGITR